MTCDCHFNCTLCHNCNGNIGFLLTVVPFCMKLNEHMQLAWRSHVVTRGWPEVHCCSRWPFRIHSISHQPPVASRPNPLKLHLDAAIYELTSFGTPVSTHEQNSRLTLIYSDYSKLTKLSIGVP